MTRRVDDTKSRGGNKERILLLSPHVSNLRVSRGSTTGPRRSSFRDYELNNSIDRLERAR